MHYIFGISERFYSLMHLNILSTFAGRFIFASFSYPCRRYSYIAIEYPVGDIQVKCYRAVSWLDSTV